MGVGTYLHNDCGAPARSSRCATKRRSGFLLSSTSGGGLKRDQTRVLAHWGRLRLLLSANDEPQLSSMYPSPRWSWILPPGLGIKAAAPFASLHPLSPPPGYGGQVVSFCDFDSSQSPSVASVFSVAAAGSSARSRGIVRLRWAK